MSSHLIKLQGYGTVWVSLVMTKLQGETSAVSVFTIYTFFSLTLISTRPPV